MNANYAVLLTDVARYHYLCTEGFGQELTAQPELSPAAEEALRDLTRRAAGELGIPHGIARQGLLYAARMHAVPLCQILVRVAAQLHLEEQVVAVP